ncbi:hypothetical protein LEP1GSC036_3366 [Leptospira weilii str. 2006001853]|uniref:Uncharacterized protein n=1 Tax=Leptospira weilii str. 2006001853 TaxID=1001589 RepID=A0A828YY99_9LEPT|nr:hypothetical protein LEP1GSC036_1760 [Leptospira weilii str. 2006001853]EKR64656.1 hypothetical protein LEP1GSC036_3366 [Leptospira weilii str. 2006001853]
MSIIRNPQDPEIFEAIHERVGIYAFIPRVSEPSNGLMRPIGFERQSEIITYRIWMIFRSIGEMNNESCK